MTINPRRALVLFLAGGVIGVVVYEITGSDIAALLIAAVAGWLWPWEVIR